MNKKLKQQKYNMYKDHLRKPKYYKRLVINSYNENPQYICQQPKQSKKINEIHLSTF